jgi:hypothetical protein
MDPSDQEKLVNSDREAEARRIEQLHELFGSYKAEWLRERIFEFYTAPDYLPELTTARPCILSGGRGTGKTTVLRGMSFEGQAALHGLDANVIDRMPFFGMYYRVNTNRVTAFRGPELSAHEWTRLFAHYLNLSLCDLAISFVLWHEKHCQRGSLLSAIECHEIALSLHLPEVTTVDGLAKHLRRSQIVFEAYINNVADGVRPPLSLQGAPLDLIFDGLLGKPSFAGKHFFFLIDEYENFEDYQQQVVNTLIKHSGQLYTFKVGVKELGWRKRSTLIESEQLVSPADYARISISERLRDGVFERFALQVCQSRLNHLMGRPISNIRLTLPEISEEDEAVQLGVKDKLRELEGIEAPDCTEEQLSQIADLSYLQQYFLLSWALSKKETFSSVIKDYRDNPRNWDFRYGNYKYSLLFNIRAGKRGIRKFYAGWNVFIQLAGSNIRYLLELVDQSLLLHLSKGNSLEDAVSPETQTIAAQQVGKKNLLELEGLSVDGSKLTRLLLGLGRIFEVLAADPLGHTPEVNQFRLADRPDESIETRAVDDLVKAAIMHLALVRSTGSKPTDEAHTRDYDYALHPIYAPFFVFSHRKKRKFVLSEQSLLGLLSDPKHSIREILQANNRSELTDLPEQAKLFEGYYG